MRGDLAEHGQQWPTVAGYIGGVLMAIEGNCMRRDLAKHC